MLTLPATYFESYCLVFASKLFSYLTKRTSCPTFALSSLRVTLAPIVPDAPVTKTFLPANLFRKVRDSLYDCYFGSRGSFV